mgnify:CR=1 FL=1
MVYLQCAGLVYMIISSGTIVEEAIRRNRKNPRKVTLKRFTSTSPFWNINNLQIFLQTDSETINLYNQLFQLGNWQKGNFWQSVSLLVPILVLFFSSLYWFAYSASDVLHVSILSSCD